MKPTYFLFITLFLFSCNLFDKENSNNKDPKPKHIIPKNIITPNYEMKYPSTWIIDSTDEDFDINNNFSFEPKTEDAVTLFFIYNTSVDEELQVSAQVKAHLKKALKNGTVSYFDHWGIYSGHGALITGKMMGIWKGRLKIFCHSGEDLSFLTIVEYLDKDEEIVLPGFNLIESSFKLKK